MPPVGSVVSFKISSQLTAELALCVSESSRCVWVVFLRAGAVLPFIAILGESGPLFEVRWDVKRFECLLRVSPNKSGPRFAVLIFPF